MFEPTYMYTYMHKTLFYLEAISGCCSPKHNFFGSVYRLQDLFGRHFQFLFNLRWLKTVSSTDIWMGRYNHSLSLDATIRVSKICPIIGEHVVIIFLTQ